MGIQSDVLVVGGGLAGSMAALAAAREDPAATVRLVTDAESTLGMASGLIDLLGYVDGNGPVVDPFEAIGTLHDEHPYRLLGVDVLREALVLFDDVVEEYRGGHADENALVATHGGTVKPTGRYPESVAPGLASAEGDVLLVGFETLPDFDAPLAAEHLTAVDVPFETAGVTIRFPGEPVADPRISWYTNRLDENDPVTVYGRERGTRRVLGERIRRELHRSERRRDRTEDTARVGLPAVLGHEETTAIRADLAETIGADVFEVPGGPPSIPGMRLDNRLSESLEAAGVAVDAGNSVAEYDVDSTDALEQVFVDRCGTMIPFEADQFVLATGGLVGKGVEADRRAVREPVFDCHVPHPDDRYDWFEDGVFDDHPFARFGVDVGPDLRPRDATGSPEFENLRAAGSVIGGYDFAAEKSGSGVSIATGYAAGRAAARGA